MSNVILNAGISSQHEPFDPIQQTLDYVSRVESDGGTVGNTKLIDAALRPEVNNDRYNSNILIYLTGSGWKGDLKLYSLDPGDNDQAGLSDITITDNKIDVVDGAVFWGDDVDEAGWTWWSWIKSNSTSLQGLAGRSAGVHRSIRINNNNEIQYRDDGSNVKSATTHNFVSNWVFLAAQGTGTNIKLYSNGGKILDTTTTENALFRKQSLWNVNGNTYSGWTDLTCVRSVNVSDSEILELFNATKKFYGY